MSDRAFIASIFDSNPIQHILHAVTLHKPHVCSHSKEQFISTNILGTLVLLEESSRFSARVESFVFFSTTSAFGMALSPKPGLPAAWIDESVVPMPKNIYGVTKVAAEGMCALMQKQSGMPVLILCTSRFFLEEDDDEDRRAAMSDENLKVLELAYRRCDIEDIVSASVCAMRKARDIRWRKYIISSPPPNKPQKTRRTYFPVLFEKPSENPDCPQFVPFKFLILCGYFQVREHRRMKETDIISIGTASDNNLHEPLDTRSEVACISIVHHVFWLDFRHVELVITRFWHCSQLLP